MFRVQTSFPSLLPFPFSFETLIFKTVISYFDVKLPFHLRSEGGGAVRAFVQLTLVAVLDGEVNLATGKNEFQVKHTHTHTHATNTVVTAKNLFVLN